MKIDLSKYQMVPPELAARNAKMLRLSKAGASLREIALVYGLSHERVRQLLERERRNAAAKASPTS